MSKFFIPSLPTCVAFAIAILNADVWTSVGSPAAATLNSTSKFAVSSSEGAGVGIGLGCVGRAVGDSEIDGTAVGRAVGVKVGIDVGLAEITVTPSRRIVRSPLVHVLIKFRHATSPAAGDSKLSVYCEK